MGMPSIGIYSYELYKFYGVENIIRIGTAGAYSPKLDVFDTVLAKDCWSESTYALAQGGNTSDVQLPSPQLNEKIEQAAKELGIELTLGRIHSSDVFYHEDAYNFDFYNDHGCDVVEMESFALFHNAKVLGKHAACLVTVSDSLVTHKETTAEERQTSFTNMMKIALEAAINA